VPNAGEDFYLQVTSTSKSTVTRLAMEGPQGDVYCPVSKAPPSKRSRKVSSNSSKKSVKEDVEMSETCHEKRCTKKLYEGSKEWCHSHRHPDDRLRKVKLSDLEIRVIDHVRQHPTIIKDIFSLGGEDSQDSMTGAFSRLFKDSQDSL
jgi:hypothetical protein